MFSPNYSAACSGISIIVAEDEHKEALSIALAMRESLESGSKSKFGFTAALVTPNRNLAHRVKIEFESFWHFD